ncbi:unnamed protein product [Rotaria magnacalcarata]|uniref:Reverse transcriptase domain-containing protein n=1 Tax=Rotaria magnacalcarata TaxID=392030 RepID=A0A816FU67_9BILA|nr:unnamed protein product [Rotaria magnacalcarata]
MHVLSYWSNERTNNEYINRLITIREQQAEIWKEQLKFETRIYCKFLAENFDQLDDFFLTSIDYLPLNRDTKIIEIKNKRYKIIQETKRHWLNYFLHIYEIKIQKYEQQYQNEFIKFESLFSTNNDNMINDTTLLNNINEYINTRINRLKKDIYNEMASFRRIILQNRQRSSTTKTIVGVSSEPYLDLISNPFDKRQWNYLSLGPSYIRVNQSAIRPKCQQETEIKNQHKDIYSKVENHLHGFPHRIPRNNAIFKQYSDHLLDYLDQSYFTPISYRDQLISREQAHILGSIRRTIEKRNLIIRVTDKGNNFYIGSAVEFEKNAENFFSDTNAFIELSSNPFNEILDEVIQLLNALRGKDLIRKWQYEEMMPDRTNCELAHLCFNPKTHKDGIPVRPIESTIHAATTKISKFLDKILRPIFDDKCKDTTIIDGASLITELSKYNKKGLLKSTTLFCTFDIRNLYTMLPQEETLDTLMTFLHVHGYRKVKGISIDTIKKLASIILKDNVFAYGKKIYKQTTGGAMGSSLTLTLANIFMAKWQKNIVEEQMKTGEFYGRYIDDIFMTWNRSEEELRKYLHYVNTWHPNIKLDYKIGYSLPFLDIQLTNNNGILSTSVYHKPAAEPYVTPFTSDHPRHVFSHIIKTFIERAARYSTTFEAFNYERRSIKLMLLYNDYPSIFIENEFHKYFSEYVSKSPFLQLIDDKQKYFLKRNQILGQPTPRQSQVAMSAALADIDNDPPADEKQQPDRSEKKSEEIISNYNEKFFTHFTYEKRFATCKRDMHEVYHHTFKDTPAMYTKQIVGNRNRRPAQNELIHKRPNRTLLKNKTIKKKKN